LINSGEQPALPYGALRKRRECQRAQFILSADIGFSLGSQASSFATEDWTLPFRKSCRPWRPMALPPARRHTGACSLILSCHSGRGGLIRQLAGAATGSRAPLRVVLGNRWHGKQSKRHDFWPEWARAHSNARVLTSINNRRIATARGFPRKSLRNKHVSQTRSPPVRDISDITSAIQYFGLRQSRSAVPCRRSGGAVQPRRHPAAPVDVPAFDEEAVHRVRRRMRGAHWRRRGARSCPVAQAILRRGGEAHNRSQELDSHQRPRCRGPRPGADAGIIGGSGSPSMPISPVRQSSNRASPIMRVFPSNRRYARALHSRMIPEAFAREIPRPEYANRSRLRGAAHALMRQ